MKNLSFFLLSLCIVMLSCQEDDAVKPSLSINQAEFIVSNEAGSQDISFESNMNWTAASSDSWCSISPSSGAASVKKLSVNFSPNDTYSVRSCTVTIKAGDLSKEVTINQGGSSGLLITQDKYDLNNDATTIEVEVKANVEYDVTIPDKWITMVVARSLSAKTISFKIAKNDSYDSRAGSIIIKQKNGPLVSTINVYQSQKGYYYVSPNGEGDKSGDSKENAADFLNDKIWDKVRKSVKDNKVTVHFLDGEYGRSYTENNCLELFNLGNPKHQILLKGGDNVIFTFPEGLDEHADQAIHVGGSQNMIIDGFHFTGHGKADWGIRFYGIIGDDPSIYETTTNITLQNSSFIDMEGLYLGAVNVQGRKTTHITLKNNTMKHVGVDAHAHFLYTAGYATHTSVIDSYFENCTGDYVRFRGGCDYSYVEGSTFVKSLDRFEGHGFISVPVFNSMNPGKELFKTNFSFVNNVFKNTSNVIESMAMRFVHHGYAPAKWDYLLTAEEGKILTSGTKQERKELLLTNFGLDVDKIRIHGNTIATKLITRKLGIWTMAHYGAKSKGFDGVGDITDIVNHQSEPFDWEP